MFFYTARKRQAALNEVQRLKREGTLRPVKAGSPDMGNGALSISAITLSLKPEYIRHMGLGKYKVIYSFVTFV